MRSAFSDYYNITASHILVSLHFALDKTEATSLSSSLLSVPPPMSSLAFLHSAALVQSSVSLLLSPLLISTDTLPQLLVSLDQELLSRQTPVCLNSTTSIQIASLSSSSSLT